MRNFTHWYPSKYRWRDSKLRASRDPTEVATESRLISDLVAEQYQRVIPVYARGDLIDLGCGRVPLYGVYRGHVDEVTCVDWPNSVHQSPHLDCTCDLSRPLPFDDASFDTVILSDVLEHLPEPSVVWREMARILRTGGHVVVSVPFFYWLHEMPHDYYRYTESALKRFAERSGFEVIELRAIGGASEIVADIFAKHLIRIPLIGRSMASIIQEFVRVSGGRFRSSRARNTRCERLPLAYMMVARRIGEAAG